MNGGVQLSLGPTGARPKPLFPSHIIEELTSLPGAPTLEASAELLERLETIWLRERETLVTANEAQTENRWIHPIVETLGFAWIVRPAAELGGRAVELDMALYGDDERRLAAERLSGTVRFDGAWAIVEAKRFERDLDTRRAAGARSEDPVAQTIQYLAATGVRWAILTNGRLWRLYGAEGDLVEGACHETDLVAAVEGRDAAAIRTFLMLFGRDAYVPGHDGRNRLDALLEQSLAREVEVGEALERQVYRAVPLLAQGLLGDDEPNEANLTSAFEHALVLLFRLLFCLHAEDRGLLPVDNSHYRHYSVRERRARIAGDVDSGRRYSGRSEDLFNDLRGLFSIVNRGDSDLGVNEYDGGLFDNADRPWLEERAVPDSLLAPALDCMFRVSGRQVDYADLSVRHLGTIYEQLLAYRLVRTEDGLELIPSDERHDSGSYFTPEFVVDEIIEQTLGPLLGRVSGEIADAGLAGEEALEAFLRVKVLDPAMGSGHFLISAAAFIAQQIANDPAYADGDHARDDLMRLAAERCIYGVDLNPMAVELARVALWLATVRGDRPLTFLGNLRVGNSLVGSSVSEMLTGGDTVFADQLAREAHELLDLHQRSQAVVDETADGAHEKQRLAAVAAALREPLERMADERLAPRFTGVGDSPFFHWEIEFPEVFLDDGGLPLADGGFDAVVGNPPYVRIQRLGRELASYARAVYRTASGSFDVYVPFIERAIDLLGPRGRLGFIVPSKFQRLAYGARLRELLSEGRMVERIVDFQHAQVFPGATNYTCILVADRAGTDDLGFEQVSGTYGEVRRCLARPAGDRVVERYPTSSLDADPWVLATGEEARLLNVLRDRGTPLEDCCQQIFTGLQTSADAVYIVEDRGTVQGLQRVYSRASDRELDLEPDLLRPLASGGEVGRYAFELQGRLLLFPYRPDSDRGMAAVTEEELSALPLTQSYLQEHEVLLRGRERGRMDSDGWWAYVYPKSLAAHQHPKLGVPRLCERLRAAADPYGGIHLDNVDVNGILPATDVASLATLAAAINTKALDWVFRRYSVPFRGAYFSANKQFISHLPVPHAEDSRLESLGRQLIAVAAAISDERRGFLVWLSDSIRLPLTGLAGINTVRRFVDAAFQELLAAVQQNDVGSPSDLRSRAFVDALRAEWNAATARIAEHRATFAPLEAEAETLVYDLFHLTHKQRALIDAEYPS